MVGRSVDQKYEIWAYIKARSKLGYSLKQLVTELSTTSGPSCVSYDTVRSWENKFESCVEFIKNAPKSGRPKFASHKEIVSKIKGIIEGDENWVYYFEPVRKFSNKIWASRHSRRPIIAIRSLSARKVWYAIFFSGKGVAIKVPMENG